MTKQEFREFVKDKIVYLDGATGTNLAKAGMPGGVCTEKWVSENPDAMLELQRRFISAGSDILYAPTFTANSIKLAEYGLENEQEDLIRTLVGISKQAASECKDRKVLVAGDITMTGRQLKPMGNLELEDLIDVYKQQIKLLEKYGCDILVVETMMSLAETRAALIAAKETTDLPIIVTLTFEASGRTLFGTDAVTGAVVCESLGADAIGVNCSTGPAQMVSIVSDMAANTRIPIIAKPNAGLPELDENNKTVYKMDADTFASEMEVLVDAGAQIIGGCCGTTPEFIEAVNKKFGRGPVRRKEFRQDGIRYLSSERKTLAFGLDGRFIIVGERINPTGKKALQAELREGNTDRILQFATEQEENGAGVLDINVGMGGIDEGAMMLRVIDEVTQATSLPLCLDSSSPEILEAALRHYPGRALVNSVSLEPAKFERLLPTVAKYGAVFILLPLSEKGLPKDLDEKKEIIDIIYKRAVELGLTKDNIVVDGLVQTVGADQSQGVKTLETIRYAHDNGFATITGLSNISFGLPERSYVNSTFLTLAIANGLTMAISNPGQELLVAAARATDLLLNKPESDIAYIETAGRLKEAREAKEELLKAAATNTSDPGAAPKKSSGDEMLDKVPESLRDIYKAVVGGNRNAAPAAAKAALEKGEKAADILNDCLIPAINQVGAFFNSGKYFLPQLISSAESMKSAIAVIEPELKGSGSSEDAPSVVIATVEGDIHDIGKNLVAMMLGNYGFNVIDMGKDIKAEDIVAKAEETGSKIICLSALMTTTMIHMKESIELVKQKGLDIKVMVGGACVTEEYAQEIGADGYSKDAAEAVKVAKSLLGMPE
ncbi:MAG: homocysteine S-methyltransferase family protein [Lachnospiraceae bacterium]|nr:homocysteine S-methyltransferase family protein [Lachnospiraceae bacterium]